MKPIEKLVIATHNPGKLREIQELLAPLGIACVGAAELGLPEPEEIGNTFIDNAELKAREASDLSGLPALADDSGLGRGRVGQSQLPPGHGARLARRRDGWPRSRPECSFRLRFGDRLAG
jgi:XTP/dITP diphosphohydrolase